MRRSLKNTVLSAITAATLLMGAELPGGTAHAAPLGPKECEVVDGRQPQTATPEEVGLDADALRAAMALAADRSRRNIQVFRNNCLIAAGPNNAHTGGVPWNLWSGTKSVVSLIVGIAIDEGRLRLDDPIDRYLPAGVGDAAHRAITIRSLLTETSGLRVAVAAEGVTGVAQLDPNVVAQAMAIPIDRPQGVEWRYSQRGVDLLLAVVQQAVGMDVQAYAQQKLFAPLGIQRTDYYWGRDRAGNTYGHAHLLLPPDDYVKLGLLVVNRGDWHGNRVVSADYLAQAAQPTMAAECYGFLFVVNPSRCTIDLPGLPADAMKISGMMRQDSFIVPSIGLLITSTGVADPDGTVSYTHDVLRGIVGAFREPRLPDPGPYVPHPDTSIADPSISNPAAVLGALGIGSYAYPGCGQLECLGRPLAAPFGDWPPGCFVVGCFGPHPDTPGIR
ncbi:serine hydrolase domain-containing protein [Nocardia sp. NPDC049149]|uniref:serine hydrolase domain-containing protein n=1 Tax=Nocardia sp. NPDC049149 TaxID=3364315 RepID=UPI00371988C7